MEFFVTKTFIVYSLLAFLMSLVPELSIVIPARNEEKRHIDHVLLSYISYFSTFFLKPFEILVVVNASSDRTLELVQNISRKYHSVHCLDLGHRGGKGLALLEGFQKARGKFIGFVDADGSTSAESFKK